MAPLSLGSKLECELEFALRLERSVQVWLLSRRSDSCGLPACQSQSSARRPPDWELHSLDAQFAPFTRVWGALPVGAQSASMEQRGLCALGADSARATDCLPAGGLSRARTHSVKMNLA